MQVTCAEIEKTLTYFYVVLNKRKILELGFKNLKYFLESSEKYYENKEFTDELISFLEETGLKYKFALPEDRKALEKDLLKLKHYEDFSIEDIKKTLEYFLLYSDERFQGIIFSTFWIKKYFKEAKEFWEKKEELNQRDKNDLLRHVGTRNNVVVGVDLSKKKLINEKYDKMWKEPLIVPDISEIEVGDDDE